MIWEIAQVDWTDSNLEHLLADGWEPFAVTTDREGPPTIWLRRPRKST